MAILPNKAKMHYNVESTFHAFIAVVANCHFKATVNPVYQFMFIVIPQVALVCKPGGAFWLDV